MVSNIATQPVGDVTEATVIGLNVLPSILPPSGMPPSFLGMIHGITTAESYTAAVRGEILAAGDNCSRVAFVGAYMGAK